MKKFYKCPICGKIVKENTEAFGKLFCCGKPMEELKANATEAAVEKHIPEVTAEGNCITAVVGSVIHPMSAEHHIGWIYLETEKGGQFRYLNPEDEPKARFMVSDDDKAKAVYSYCNLHGLWVKEL